MGLVARMSWISILIMVLFAGLIALCLLILLTLDNDE